MGLAGNLKTMALPDLMLFLASRESTGTLELSCADAWAKLYFERGRIISSSSSEPTEQLGHFLVSKNQISEEQLSRAMEVQAKTKVMLGKILVMIGAVTEDDLLEMLERKCTQTVFSIFLWEEADFRFLDHQLPAVRLIPTSIAAETLVKEGETWKEDWKRLSQEYPSPTIRFARTNNVFYSSASEDPLLISIYELVDGHRTIAEIAMQTHASYHRILQALDLLRRKNVISVAGVGESQKTPPAIIISAEQLLQTAREKLAFGKWEEAINLFQYILLRDPENAQARSLISQAEKQLTLAIYEELIQPDSIPRLIRSTTELLKDRFDAEESFLITRINGRWSVRTILTVTPLREVDSLRALKRLLDRKIIAVEPPGPHDR